MLHGPCKEGVCLENGKCLKKFPKVCRESTKLNSNGYHEYKRSSRGYTAEKNGYKDTNEYVVPNNHYLTTKYNAHINVEVCSSVQAVKYIYKYVYKGKYFFLKISYDIDLKKLGLNSNLRA